MYLPRSKILTTFALTVALAFSFGFKACENAPQAKLEKKKAAVYDIQKTVDGSADALVFVQANNLAPPTVVKDFAAGLQDVNRANKALINAAWAESGDLQSKLDALKSVLQTFLNSGTVKGVLPTQLKAIVDKLTDSYNVLKGG